MEKTMTDVNTLWGDLRSLASKPLDEDVRDEWEQPVSSDAARAVEVVNLVSKFPDALWEEARQYARTAVQRNGVDGDLFDVATRFDSADNGGVMLKRYFLACREGYVGQVYTRDYQGQVVAFYYEDGTLYKTEAGYGSCSYCCAFEAAYMSGRAAQVLRSFYLRGMCKVVEEDVPPEDVRHHVEMEHASFVMRYGEYATVGSHYTDDSWKFSTDFNSYMADYADEQDAFEGEDAYHEDDEYLDLYDEYEDYDY
jgi:hypothetical protein